MKTRLATLCLTVLSLGGLSVGSAADSPSAAAQAVNALGLDLLAKGTDANANTLLSPYSIQAALAMTYAGAAGDTRSEMARVLHYPADEAALHQSFASLQKALDEVTKTTTALSKGPKEFGRPGVFHKTFLALDEKGTEAAAATAVAMARAMAIQGEKPKPIVVRVDRPFLFAIQHVPSGACLFVGRVTDPR